MIKVIPAAERHYNDLGWLKTNWLFSFDTYHDPSNVNFGPLRVFNDDVVAPGSGFPPHAHAEMEIITIVLSGEVTHSDSMGNKTVIRAGDVQRMTAGTGVRHSEFNFGDESLHLYQIWIMPDKRGLKPSYEQQTMHIADLKNRLRAVASNDTGLENTVFLNTDATIYMSDMDAGNEHEFRVKDGRRAFIYMALGEIDLNGNSVKVNDQARVEGETVMRVIARAPSRFVLIDIP